MELKEVSRYENGIGETVIEGINKDGVFIAVNENDVIKETGSLSFQTVDAGSDALVFPYEHGMMGSVKEEVRYAFQHAKKAIGIR